MPHLLKSGDTIAYSRQHLIALLDHSHKTASRRGKILGPANVNAESGYINSPITAETWLIEVEWSDGQTQRINPRAVCTRRSVAFVE